MFFSLLNTAFNSIVLAVLGLPCSAATRLALQAEDSSKRFCVYCDIVISGDYVKHCKLCERCVVNMDHHCLFLLKCVAKNNHRLFTIFIFLTVLDIIFFLVSTWRCFLQLYADSLTDQISNLVGIMAREHTFLFFVVILNAASCLWGIMLLRWQLILVSEGRTFYKSIKGDSSSSWDRSKLTFRARFSNLVKFFGGSRNSSSATSSVSHI